MSYKEDYEYMKNPLVFLFFIFFSNFWFLSIIFEWNFEIIKEEKEMKREKNKKKELTR